MFSVASRSSVLVTCHEDAVKFIRPRFGDLSSRCVAFRVLRITCFEIVASRYATCGVESHRLTPRFRATLPRVVDPSLSVVCIVFAVFRWVRWGWGVQGGDGGGGGQGVGVVLVSRAAVYWCSRSNCVHIAR